MRQRPTRPRAVLATLGTLGDIYPFVTVAGALIARGIDAVVAAPDTHRAAIENEGVPFVRIRPSDDELGAALNTDVAGAYRIMLDNPHFILDEIYMRFLREIYEDVLSAAKGADVLVTHSLLVGAHLAAETLGVPHARIGLAPMHLQSATAPSMTPSTPYLLQPRTPLAVLYNTVVRAAVRASVNLRSGRLRAFRREIGLPPSGEDFFLDFGRRNRADRIFGLYSPHFAPAQRDQPRNLEVVGFPFARPTSAARRQLDPQLQAFLSAGSPPVVFTLGSFAPAVSGSFYDVSIRAARRIGVRAVLLAGPRDTARLEGRVGPGEHVCPCAPHHLLFPQCLGVVHHGGIGTTAESLRAGKPQIVVPFFGDQPDNAARLARLGIGIPLKLSAYDDERACKALEAMKRGDPARRAAALADSLRLDGGVELIGDWVEEAAWRRVPNVANTSTQAVGASGLVQAG